MLALLLCCTELNIIAMIGIILLIGIVKKNAILMIDFAIAAERTEGNSPEESIYQACLLRFRPIMMTTMAAMLGGVPIAVGGGNGSELRRPLGIAIVGGLMVSQMLTLYTTPVVYLYLDRFDARLSGGKTCALSRTIHRHPSPGFGCLGLVAHGVRASLRNLDFCWVFPMPGEPGPENRCCSKRFGSIGLSKVAGGGKADAGDLKSLSLAGRVGSNPPRCIATPS